MSDKKVFFSHSNLVLNGTNEILHKVAKESAKQKESILMEQLNEFIKRGLIVVEETQPMFTTAYEKANLAGYEVVLSQGVRLVLKEQEYVEKLEKENEELKQKLLTITQLLNQCKDY